MSPFLLAQAPHRLLFFVGAANVLAAMGWWTFWLVAMRWGGLELPQPALPAGWLHAVIMQYHVLPSFIFGFLLTVFPRWLGGPAIEARHYLPVGLGLLGGQILTLAGLGGGPGGGLALLRAGALLTLAGWALGMIWLARAMWRAPAGPEKPWHALSCLVALGFGLVGVAFHVMLTFRPDAQVAYVAIKLGGLAMLLPIYFTVCHRMIPFFTQCVVPGYRMVRPMWMLAAFWVLVVAHLWLEMRHAYALLWLADLPLLLLGCVLLTRWWPPTAMPPLLRVLYAGFAWLPVAFALYTFQSARFAATGDFLLGRAPAHALFIGFFGSLLVAMVTRVTQGHAGRPLVLGGVAALAFALVQVTAVLRIVAEIAPDAGAWQAIAAIGWLAAFLPWALRSASIYLAPRADGRPG